MADNYTIEAGTEKSEKRFTFLSALYSAVSLAN
jgi:hypothetical protein